MGPKGTTLLEYLLKVVDELGVKSDEFKDLEILYGKNKLREMYVEAKLKQKSNPPKEKKEEWWQK